MPEGPAGGEHLLLRGSRDFDSIESYEAFLFEVMERRNRGRQQRLAEERAAWSAQQERAAEELSERQLALEQQEQELGRAGELGEQIAALEEHVRALTEAVQASQADLVEGRIAILALQAKVDEKVSAADVDPAMVKLNQELGVARKTLEEASNAASESWATLQGGVQSAFDTLRTSVREAADRIKES